VQRTKFLNNLPGAYTNRVRHERRTPPVDIHAGHGG
jgi:hypothetical protein